MRRRTIVISLFTLFVLALGSTTASAQSNWVSHFLSRYRPLEVAYPAAAGQSQQELAAMIRNGQLPLTEAQVINLILSNNIDIGVDRLSPLSSDYLMRSLYRAFEPQLNLGTSVNHSATPASSEFTGAASLIQTIYTNTIGYTQLLQSGTNVAVSFSMIRSSSNSEFNTFNPTFNGSMNYSIVQHLLRGYGKTNATRQIRQAKNNQAIAGIQFEEQVIDLVVQAQKAYWDLVFNAEDLKVKQRSMELAEKTETDNEAQVRIGTMAPIDVIQSQSEVATRQEALVVSTFTQVQSEDQVKKLITSQSDPGMILARLSPVQPARRPAPGDVAGIAEAIQIALENRPEMRQLTTDLKNKDIDVQYTKNQLLPIVDLSASYSQAGIGGPQVLRKQNPADPTNPFDLVAAGIIPGGFTSTFSQLFGYNYTGYQIGFNVQIPLTNHGAQADNARAMTEKRIAENKINSTAQQIALDVRNALTQVEMNRARIEAAQKARELAERQLAAEQKKFDLGASTVRFVLEEQRNVTQAQTDEIAALVNYTKALVDYDRATGMTLKKNNIQIDKTLTSPPSGN